MSAPDHLEKPLTQRATEIRKETFNQLAVARAVVRYQFSAMTIATVADVPAGILLSPQVPVGACGLRG